MHGWRSSRDAPSTQNKIRQKKMISCPHFFRTTGNPTAWSSTSVHAYRLCCSWETRSHTRNRRGVNHRRRCRDMPCESRRTGTALNSICKNERREASSVGLAPESQEALDARRIAAFKKSLAQVFFPLSAKICDVGPAIPRNCGQIDRWGFSEADRISASIFAKRRLSLTRRRKKTVLAPPLLGSGSVTKFQIYKFLKQTLL